MKFCWTTIHVKNMQVSLEFYQETVGLELNRRMNPSDGMELAFLGAGETQIELICNQSETDVAFGTDISIGFQTPSLEQLTEKLIAEGVPVHAGPFQPNPHIRFLYVLDPDGLKVQFVEFISATP